MALRRPPTTFSDQITDADIGADSIGTSELKNDAVETANIKDSTGASDGITAAKIATDAVIAAKIATGAVVADGIGAGAVVAAGIGTGAVVEAKLGTGAVTTAKMASDLIEVKPHIKHGWLYPAMKDTGGAVRQTDGVTAVVASTVGPAGSAIASSLYGTVQSDGKMYYYTDIKGSKPIKDPRIGAYFGGQRYKIRSLQFLEQETATHGDKVYLVDGREWCRAYGTLVEVNNDDGHRVKVNGADTSGHGHYEIVGNFSGVNAMRRCVSGSNQGFVYSVDGAAYSAEQTGFEDGGVNSPFRSRYVDSSNLLNVVSGQTLGIHTINIRSNATSDYGEWHNFELIAHDKFTDATCDTTNTDATVTMDSTAKLSVGLSVTGTGVPAGASVASITNATTFELSANATATNANQTFTFGGNDISIPAQNVVSYGKRFAISATSLHHNPFAFKTDGATAWASAAHNGTSWPVGTGSSHNIDTATSLGLAGWLHSSNYYKPYNGGRVVIWVDSAGAIKTSVNVMPPNARSITAGAITAKANASVANNTYLPTFEAGSATAYESSSLAEVAKTFHWREFGNGAANGGSAATYVDCSMLQAGSTDNIAYVMDDGLTSLSGVAVRAITGGSNGPSIGGGSANGHYHITFIGTGVTVTESESVTAGATHHYVQNLPYGTHILKTNRESASDPTITIDGVSLGTPNINSWSEMTEVTFYQPKMPPIPEDAVVIADYMLMADYVQQAGDPDSVPISKGVRSCCGGRDVLVGDTTSLTANVTIDSGNVGPWGLYSFRSGARATVKLPYFGTAVNTRMQDTALAQVLTIDGGSAIATTPRDCSAESTRDMRTMSVANSGVAIGTHTVLMTSSASYVGRFIGFDVVTPIHTSSHYQTFETPYLHELVGGDRNMEQTNLVVTPDGKSWDEVTRDTSYMGKTLKLNFARDGGDYAGESTWMSDLCRGGPINYHAGHVQKDFCNAYDRVQCLVDGYYKLRFDCSEKNTNANAYWYFQINGTQYGITKKGAGTQDNLFSMPGEQYIQLKRGDYIKIIVYYISGDDEKSNAFTIEKL